MNIDNDCICNTRRFRWVSPQAIILTDFTVDRPTLHELGFERVLQKTLASLSADDRLNNRTVMDYLRRIVPKVFQNTLSLLSTATIQQFLDELVWRETRAESTSAADAFHHMLEDIATQTSAETGCSIISRISSILSDPFQNWALPANAGSQAAAAVPVEQQAQQVARKVNSAPPAPAIENVTTVALKRSAPASLDISSSSDSSSPKIAKMPVYYATLPPTKQEAKANCDSKDAEIICQVLIFPKSVGFVSMQRV